MWGDVQYNFGGFVGGNDTFAFRPSNGNDFVYDFHKGEDIIELGGFYNIPAKAAAHLPANIPSQALSHILQTFSDLNIETVDTNSDTVADSSVIHIDPSNSITVVGVTGLTAADFHFVV
jgi:hypothetical protein